MWQIVVVGLIVAFAVWGLFRSFRKDPCTGCPLKEKCRDKDVCSDKKAPKHLKSVK